MTPQQQQRLIVEMERARNHEGDLRSKCVTLECGHLRLMPHLATIMGVDSHTGCKICTEANPTGEQIARRVCKIEETGSLDLEAWRAYDERMNPT